jgi:hypothetical protein
MKVMPITTIAYPIGGILTSATGLVESVNATYNPATGYTQGQKVFYQGKDYESVPAAANTGVTPGTDATKWLDLGYSNLWSMFDADKNTASVGNSDTMTFVLTPGRRIGGLAVFGALADRIRVTGFSVLGGGTVYPTRTINLLARNTRTWYEYFFGAFTYRQSAIFYDLPPYSDLVLVVEVYRAASSGFPEIETMAIGMPVNIGGIRFGATSDILDFSKIERDATGGATLVRKKNVPTAAMQAYVTKETVAKLAQLRKSLTATPAIWTGMDDGESDYFDMTAMVGIFRRMPIIIEYDDYSLVGFELEGL